MQMQFEKVHGWLLLCFFYLVGTYYIRGKHTSSTGVVQHKKNMNRLCGWVVLAKTTSAN